MTRFDLRAWPVLAAVIFSAAPALAQSDADAALERCLEIAGPPSAAVPVSAEAQQDSFARLADAQAACRAAGDAGPALFHLATIAQARSRHRQALSLYEQAAEAGVGAAYSRIGDYYNFGIAPIRSDVEKALEAYRAGIELGDPASETTLGMMHVLGRGVSKDPAEAKALLGSAAEDGYHFAQLRLASLLLDDAAATPDDLREAVKLMTAAARQGNMDAVLRLPELYGREIPGIAPNPAQQFRWTDFAARKGVAEAIAKRGLLFEQGIGISKNPERAAADYIAAVESGAVPPNALRRDENGRSPFWDRETALALQRILKDRDLYRGPLDGQVGGGTMAGLRRLSDG